MALVCSGASATGSVLSVWQPQMIKSFGLTNLQTGFVNAIPYGIATVLMVLWGRHSDRRASGAGTPRSRCCSRPSASRT